MQDSPRTAVRAAQPGDAPELGRIAIAAKRSWGYPESWIEAWTPILTVDDAFIGRHAVWVALDDAATPVGWSALVDDHGRAQLEHLWVLPAHQGRGIGRLLLDAVVHEAARRGHTVLHIEADPYALPFYERQGARAIGSIDAPVLGLPRTLPLLEIPLRKEAFR